MQPDRTSADGAVSVTRNENGIVLTCVHEGKDQLLFAGEFNAWRLFGMLAMMLGVELPRRVLKGIKL